MDLHLKDRVAVVVGASRGLGRAMAQTLAEEGAHVVVVARQPEPLHAFAEELQRAGHRAMALALDVTDPASASTLASFIETQFGRLDVLIGNAGGNRRKPLEDVSDADWAELMELNVLSHLRLTRTLLPLLRVSDAASILYTTSIFGREAGGPGLGIYNTTKSALISAAKIMALELAPEGIRVNTLAPGSIRFPGGSWDKRCKEDPEGMAAFVKGNIPLGRFGTAEEVARIAAFMVSPAASLLVGVTLNADGGQSRSLI